MPSESKLADYFLGSVSDSDEVSRLVVTIRSLLE